MASTTWTVTTDSGWLYGLWAGTLETGISTIELYDATVPGNALDLLLRLNLAADYSPANLRLPGIRFNQGLSVIATTGVNLVLDWESAH